MSARLLAALALLAVPAEGLAWENGQELPQVIFSSVDSMGNGTLDFAEATQLTQSIAFSADTNADERLSLKEFMAWDFGFAYLAESEGGVEGMALVKRVMFAVIDLDANKDIDARELRISTRRDFDRADFDGNGVLSEDEFEQGWTPIVMLRADQGS
ncbi:MAG: hypothetical protein ACFB01_15955 [Cohaesibacteraceae bacterium]